MKMSEEAGTVSGNMIEGKKKQVESDLKKKGNRRLDSIQATNREGTAAWANEDHKCDVCNVSIPSEDDVERAKNWVDNGSRL